MVWQFSLLLYHTTAKNAIVAEKNLLFYLSFTIFPLSSKNHVSRETQLKKYLTQPLSENQIVSRETTKKTREAPRSAMFHVKLLL